MIVRYGDLQAKVALSDLQVVPPTKEGGLPVFRMRMNRTGNRSVYGDLSVTFAPKGQTAKPVAGINGVAVYTPNEFRVVELGLQPPARLKLEHGVFRVTYRERLEEGGALLAEGTLNVP